MKTNLSNTLGLKSMARESGGVFFWMLAILVFFILIFMTIGPGMFEPAFVLAFGWVQFLQRTISAMSWNWDLIGMSVLASGGILLLVQKLLGGIFDKVAVSRDLPWRWSWRWTWTGFAGLLILFLVGMAVGGITHQVGWMMSTNEPLMEAKRGRWRDYSNMKQLDLEIRMMLDDAGGDVHKARTELQSDASGYSYEASPSTPNLQAYHVLLVKGDDGKVIGKLIFPRDGTRREKAGGYFTFDGGVSASCPWPKFQEIIRTNRANLVAF